MRLVSVPNKLILHFLFLSGGIAVVKSITLLRFVIFEKFNVFGNMVPAKFTVPSKLVFSKEAVSSKVAPDRSRFPLKKVFVKIVVAAKEAPAKLAELRKRT